MFTGLIEEVGEILRIEKKEKSLTLEIEANKLINKINKGDSISVNGVCLTATIVNGNSFRADVSPETFKKTNLKFLKPKSKVNLETSLTLNKPLGGHIVLGHVDGVGKVISKNRLQEFYEFIIDFPSELGKYMVEKGSIAINGISLTINKIYGNSISLMIIPHTFENTNLKYSNSGDFVNIEVDIIGKYVENMLKFNKSSDGISMDFLKKYGFA